MFIFGDMLSGIVTILIKLLEVYKWIVIIAVLISWVNPDPYNPIVRFLYSVTEPVLKHIRRFIGHRLRPYLGPIDISPIILILIIIIIQSFLVRSVANNIPY